MKSARIESNERTYTVSTGNVARCGRRITAALRHSLLRACMQMLAAPSRDLLQLRYDAGLSLRQVALKLDRTESAVQVGLSRVRKWLMECVARRASPGEGLPS